MLYLSNLKSATVIEKIEGIFHILEFWKRFLLLVLYILICPRLPHSVLLNIFCIACNPAYSKKSNGHAEVSVESMKTLFKKTLDSGDDPYLVCLNSINTPCRLSVRTQEQGFRRANHGRVVR